MGVLREALVPNSLTWEGCLERTEADWRGSGMGGAYASAQGQCEGNGADGGLRLGGAVRITEQRTGGPGNLLLLGEGDL